MLNTIYCLKFSGHLYTLRCFASVKHAMKYQFSYDVQRNRVNKD